MSFQRHIFHCVQAETATLIYFNEQMGMGMSAKLMGESIAEQCAGSDC